MKLRDDKSKELQHNKVLFSKVAPKTKSLIYSCRLLMRQKSNSTMRSFIYSEHSQQLQQHNINKNHEWLICVSGQTSYSFSFH